MKRRDLLKTLGMTAGSFGFGVIPVNVDTLEKYLSGLSSKKRDFTLSSLLNENPAEAYIETVRGCPRFVRGLSEV